MNTSSPQWPPARAERLASARYYNPMDFRFFEELSDDEAKVYLERYLEVESQAVAESIRAADGVKADFSVDSVPGFFTWLFQFVKRVIREPDPDMPDWLREAQESMGGFIDFADESKPLVLRASYYLGESFARTYPKLRWTVGAPGTAQEHMPVIAGFSDGDEMAPMLVAENTVTRALRGPGIASTIEEVVNTWKKSVGCATET